MKLIRSYALGSISAALVCVASAHAQLVVHTATVSGISVPGTAGTVIPQFDPDLGVLRWAEVRVSGLVWGTLALENTTAVPALNGVYNVGANIATTFGPFTFPNVNPGFESDKYPAQPPMSAFDGTLDFQGTSSTTYTFAGVGGSGSPSQTIGMTHSSSFGPWIGPAGGGGVMPFNFQTTLYEFGFLAPGVMETEALSAQVYLTVKYGYEPFPARICLPPSHTPTCPCGVSPGSLDRGCANSVSSGALLSFAGTPSINNDTLQLQGSGMPDGPALYFQGNTFNHVTTAFGDGLLCVTGSIVRLGIKFNVGGASTYPEPGDASISVQGGIIAPALGCYQIYYRDAAAFCTSATFNLSNGYALKWVP